MTNCHYCQQQIKRGQKRKTLRSRMTNLETGKSQKFLDDCHFHIECYAELEVTRQRLNEKLKVKYEKKGTR